jgi:hypothetical protein
MTEIYQRIRELSPQKFEALCYDLLQARFKGVEIRKVEGSSGDEGVDFFLGRLDAGPTVWQCKRYTGPLRASQRSQIKHSLKTAIKKVRPRFWVLCVSIDLDMAAQRWFQQLAEQTVECDLGLLQASELAYHLHTFREIRNSYFPRIVEDALRLHELVTKTGPLTLDELSEQTSAFANQIIDRYRRLDGRFRYEVSFGKREAVKTTRMDTFMTIRTSEATIDAVVDDVEVFRKHPPYIEVSFTKSGFEKVASLDRLGMKQQFGPEDITGWSTDLGFFPNTDEFVGSNAKLVVEPDLASFQPVPVRLTFKLGGEQEIFQYVELHATQLGREYFRFESGPDAPIRVSFIGEGAPPKTGKADIKMDFAGRSLADVSKLLRVADIITGGGSIEIRFLRSETSLSCRVDVGGRPGPDPRIKQFVLEASRIQDYYGVSFPYPTDWGATDERSFGELLSLMDGLAEESTSANLGLVKQDQSLPALGQFRIKEPPRLVSICGVEISTGWILHDLYDAEISPQNLEPFNAAEPGAQISIELKARASLTRAMGVREDDLPWLVR